MCILFWRLKPEKRAVYLALCGICCGHMLSSPVVFNAPDSTQPQWPDALQYVSGSSLSLRTYDGLSQRLLVRLRSKYNACFETYPRVQSAGLMSCPSLLSVAHWEKLSFVFVGARWCLRSSPVLVNTEHRPHPIFSYILLNSSYMTRRYLFF